MQRLQRERARVGGHGVHGPEVASHLLFPVSDARSGFGSWYVGSHAQSSNGYEAAWRALGGGTRLQEKGIAPRSFSIRNQGGGASSKGHLLGQGVCVVLRFAFDVNSFVTCFHNMFSLWYAGRIYHTDETAELEHGSSALPDA